MAKNPILDSIAHSPILEVIPQEALERLLEAGQQKLIPSGEILFSVDDYPNGIYFVVSGSIQISSPQPSGRDKVIAQVRKGEIIGEMSLLMERPHIHTAKAIRDTQVVFLSRTVFDETVERFPKTVQLLSKRTIQRYEQLVQGHADSMIPKSIACLSAGQSEQLKTYTLKLVEAFGKSNRVKRLSSQDNPSPVEIDKLEQEHDFLVYEADTHPSAWSKRCMREADRIFLIAQSDSDFKLNALEKELFEDHIPKTNKQVELIIVHPKTEKTASKTKNWLENRPVFLSHHVHLEQKEDLLRQVRFILNKAIGVVLSGGGMRCFSQVGFLQAMEEEKIPVDMIYGCSGGSIIGSLFAMGLSAEAIGQSCISKFDQYKPLTHYSAPLISLIDDKYIWKIARELYNDQQIEDLAINFACIASDIVKAQKIIHRSGSVAQSVISSMSIPGIFPPVIQDGKFLVDGGILENLPIHSMRESFRGHIIAIDASPTEEFMHLRIPSSMPSTLDILKSWVNPLRKNKAMPNIKDIITRSVLLSGVQQRLQAAQETPFFMGMPVEDFDILDTSKIAKIIEIGYQHAKPLVKQWKKDLLD